MFPNQGSTGVEMVGANVTRYYTCGEQGSDPSYNSFTRFYDLSDPTIQLGERRCAALALLLLLLLRAGVVRCNRAGGAGQRCCQCSVGPLRGRGSSGPRRRTLPPTSFRSHDGGRVPDTRRARRQ